MKTIINWLLCLAVVLTFTQPAAAGDEDCAGLSFYTGKIHHSGPSDIIFVNTNIWGCVSDGNKNCQYTGGFLLLKNKDETGRYIYSWSSSDMGRPSFSVIEPGEEVHTAIPIYARKGEARGPVEITIKVCRLPS